MLEAASLVPRLSGPLWLDLLYENVAGKMEGYVKVSGGEWRLPE